MAVVLEANLPHSDSRVYLSFKTSGIQPSACFRQYAKPKKQTLPPGFGPVDRYWTWVILHSRRKDILHGSTQSKATNESTEG